MKKITSKILHCYLTQSVLMHEAETMEVYHASRILKAHTLIVFKNKRKKYNNYFAHCTIIWSVETLENDV